MRVPTEPRTPHRASSTQVGGVFYFCALFTAKAGPVQRGARSHGQGGSYSAPKAAPGLQSVSERLASAARHARRPTRAHSEAPAGTRQRKLGPEASCRGPDRARRQHSGLKASKARQQGNSHSVQAPNLLPRAPTQNPRTRPDRPEVTPNDPETGLGAIIRPLSLPETPSEAPEARPTLLFLPEAGRVPEFGAKFASNSVWIHSRAARWSGDGVLTHTVPVRRNFTHSPLRLLLVCLIEGAKNEVAAGRCWKNSDLTHDIASM